MAKKKAAKARPVKRQPRARPLPGMEDTQIRPLEDVASEYADIRDSRMELTEQETKLKARALKLMHEYGKTVYRRNGIEIRIEPGDETIKVKVKAPKAEEAHIEG